MTEREVSAAPAAGLVAITAFNSPVHESYALLTGLVRQRLGERHALLFARPVVGDGRMAWTTSAPGPIRKWQNLPPALRASLDPVRLELGREVAALAGSLARAGANTREGNLAHVLQTALAIPAPSQLFAVGDQPVMAFWGFRNPDGTVFDPFAGAVPPMPPPARFRFWPWLLVLLLPLAGLLGWWLWPHPAPPPLPPTVAPPAPVVPKPVPPKAPPAPPPSLPAPVHADLPSDRWDQHDLSMLKGCWTLGHEFPSVLHDNAGHATDHGVTRAERICFDESGHGQRVSEKDFTKGRVTCKAPLTASFDAEGHLAATQPPVRCVGMNVRWVATTLTCTRRDDNTAECLSKDDSGALSVEFRRGP